MCKRKATDDAVTTSIRVLDLSKHVVPDAYAHIVVANSKTRIVIRNRQHPPDSSSALKQNLIVESMCAHFKTVERFNRIKPYLLDTSGVSMRLLDWMVTNYAREHKLVFHAPQQAPAPFAGIGVNVWQSYRNFLRSYSKRNFDPFCRRTRLMVTFDADVDRLTYVTTAAKLNFLRWALDTGVLDYCEANIEAIEQQMIAALRVEVSGATAKKKARQRKSPARTPPSQLKGDNATVTEPVAA